MAHNKEKSEEILCFEVLGVLFLGLRAFPLAWTSFMEAIEMINNLQFLIKKIFFPSNKFVEIFGNQTLDPGLELDPDSH
jgi:hypothetical protein